MKKGLYKLLLVVVLISASFSANAQFTISAEIRPRTEFRNGFKTLNKENSDAAFFTEQRSRLYLDFKDEKYKLKLAFQDIRIWGETPQIFKAESNNTFISEAWGQYYLSEKWSVKAGRQIISYDNQRYFGGLEWAQQGRRHDALLLIYEEPKMKLHVGLAANQDDAIPEPGFLQGPGAGFYQTGGNYKTMQYAYFHKDLESTSLSLLAVNNGYQNADTTVSNKQTLGLVIKQKFSDKISVGGDIYYQTGELNKLKVNALLAGLNVTFKTKATPLTLGIEYISGRDDDETSTEIKNFSPDFGTNHAHNGYMDYFFVGPANGNVGVTDIYLKTKFKVGDKSALKVHLHEFFTGSTQLDTDNSELSSTMGTELDLVYATKPAPGVTFNLGYSQMFGTDTLEKLRGGDASKLTNWAWAMLTFKPTLFTTKKD